jgi:hypothetical protein
MYLITELIIVIDCAQRLQKERFQSSALRLFWGIESILISF